MPDKTCFSYLSLRRLLVDWQQGGQGVKDPFVRELTRAALAHSAARSHPAGEHRCRAELRVTGPAELCEMHPCTAPTARETCFTQSTDTYPARLKSIEKPSKSAVSPFSWDMETTASSRISVTMPSFHPGTRDHRRISLVPQGMDAQNNPGKTVPAGTHHSCGL